jgi:ABC-type glycerol-3-phosphate transport system substrate-binding protein
LVEDGQHDQYGGLGTDPIAALRKAIRKDTSRRRFMGMAGMYMAGAVSIEALIAACSTGTGSQTATPSSAPKQGGIKVINFFTTEDDPPTQDALKAAIDAFSVKNPDVHIVPILISGNERDERARTGLAVGQDLGIFEIDRAYSPTFVDAGYLHTLDDLISGIGGDQFTVGTRQVINGHDYVFPYGGGPFCCWYRTDLSSGAPATIDDLKAIAKANTGGGRYGISLATGGPVAVADTMPMFVWSFGGDYFDRNGNVIYDKDNVGQAVQAVADLMKFAPPGNSNWSAFKHIDNFLSGLVALSPWAGRLGVNMFEKKSPQEAKAGVVPPPWGPERIGLTRWSTLAIDKKTAYPDDAKKFVQFLLTGEAGVKYANSVPGQLVPAIKSVRDAAAADVTTPFVKAHPDWVKTLYNQTEKGTDYGGPMGANADGTLKLYNGPAAPWSQTAFGANNIDMQMLQKITLQGMSAKDGQKWAADQYKAIVKDYKAKHPSWRPYNG